jgi:hypothetical protein
MKAPSFGDDVKELIELAQKPGTPEGYFERLPTLFNRADKLFLVKPKSLSATGAEELVPLVQSSNLFVRYMTAVRARDWCSVSVIEHEILSIPESRSLLSFTRQSADK